MEQTYYLLSSVIETAENVSTYHALYYDLETAKKALEPEILSCAENFNFEDGKFVTDRPQYYEWRNQDGYGFIAQIEELTPIK